MSYSKNNEREHLEMTGKAKEFATMQSVSERLRIDEYIGMRIRQRRAMMEMSQSDLGRALGLTFQQVQKYEKGKSHIAVGRLWDIAAVLDVPFSYFLDGLEKKNIPGEVFPFTPTLAETREDFSFDPLKRKDVRELLKAYCAINDPEVAKHIVKIVKDLANLNNFNLQEVMDSESVK